MAEIWKRPFSVLVVVYTPDKQVLLLQRREPAGFWQSVTGSLDAGETPEQAARRELQEETGIIAGINLRDRQVQNQFPIHDAWRHRYAPEVQTNIEYVFTCEVAEIVAVQTNFHEHVCGEWLPCHEAAKKVFSATNRQAIEAYVCRGP